MDRKYPMKKLGNWEIAFYQRWLFNEHLQRVTQELILRPSEDGEFQRAGSFKHLVGLNELWDSSERKVVTII
jgi:hypothetical protein